MIQFFWLFDFIGLFLGRFILAIFLYKEFLNKENKILSYFYLILSIFSFLGLYSSLTMIFLIIGEIFNILRKLFFGKEKFSNLEKNFLRIALAIVYLFVGPGFLSVDRFYNIRF
jgi:uncharacterized membrane protein YphA (DoxX/SURF4 family)